MADQTRDDALWDFLRQRGISEKNILQMQQDEVTRISTENI